MIARQQAKADHRILVHADQSARLPHPTTFRDVVQQSHDFVFGQTAVEQGRAFPFGKAFLTGSAAQKPPPLGSIMTGHRQIAVATLAMIGAVDILTTKPAEVIHDVLPVTTQL
jgi:hypothetical protein